MAPLRLAAVLAALLPSLPLAGSTGPALDPGVEPTAGIDALYERFAEAYERLDPALVAALYTPTARYLLPGRGARTGRDEVERGFDDFFRQARLRDHRLSISFQILERRVVEALAYDVGLYTLTLVDGGRERRERGQFVTVAVRGDDGTWRFQVDVSSALPDD